MATTRIISMHVNQGKTIADCLTDRIDYSKNPEKTQGGELISAYQCDPKTADAEFLYSKRQYQTITGREQRHDVIAYQVRQSFKPCHCCCRNYGSEYKECSHSDCYSKLVKVCPSCTKSCHENTT